MTFFRLVLSKSECNQSQLKELALREFLKCLIVQDIVNYFNFKANHEAIRIWKCGVGSSIYAKVLSVHTVWMFSRVESLIVALIGLARIILSSFFFLLVTVFFYTYF